MPKNERQSTYNVLISERQIGSSLADMNVTVILTVDRYLHLECGEQIASLKMRRLKLSRKGKSIMVS
jgi:hypothetical protein